MSFLALIGDVPDRARIDEAIRDVLSRAEFRPHEPTWWQQFTGWIGRILAGALGRIVSWIDLDTAVGKAIVALLVIVLVAIVVHMIWSLVHVGERAKPKGPSAVLDATLPAAGAGTRELEEARRCAASGDFAGAMHALYRATLFWLDERSLVRFEASKTAGDYRRELKVAESRRSFGSMVEAFDPVAWGGRAAAPAAWERMRAAASALGDPA